jgi:hypothetical protein
VLVEVDQHVIDAGLCDLRGFLHGFEQGVAHDSEAIFDGWVGTRHSRRHVDMICAGWGFELLKAVLYG